MSNYGGDSDFGTVFMDPPTIGIEDENFVGVPKSAIFLVVSIAAAVASLSFCSRSVSTTFTFFLAFTIGRAAVGCFDEATIKNALKSYSWMSLGFTSLLLLLAPTLIFETAYSLELHDFRTFRLQIFIVGGLCYFLDFAVYALMIYLQMAIANIVSGNKGLVWKFASSWKYAALACATDLTSTETMLHQVWVPVPLYVVVKGESVISCAMAATTSDVINVTVTVPSTGAAGYVAKGIGYLIIGRVLSVLLGYISGRIAAFVLRGLSMDPIRENSIIIVFVYAIFSACRIFHGLGILGLFLFGLTLNGHRKWMNREQYETNKRIWTALAFYSNCIIVVLTGLTSSVYFNETYAIHAVIAYALSVASRACVLIICTSILRWASGGRHPIEYTCFLICASARGAASLLMVWRIYTTSQDDLWHLSAEGKQAHMMLWLIGTTVAASHLFQGGAIGWVAKKLGLAGISRADRDHLNEFVVRLNHRIKEKIAVRKSLPRYAEADWSKIERDASLRLVSQKAMKVDTVRSAPESDDEEEEAEWHARDAMHRLYDVELWSMSHFGALSLGLRQVQQTVIEAAETHSPLRIDHLIEQQHPHPFWRRLCPASDWNPRWVKVLLGERRSTWSESWRLLCCVAALSQSIVLLITFVNYGVSESDTVSYRIGTYGYRVSNLGLFISGVLALFNAAETVLRLWSQRKRLRLVYVKRRNVLDWLYLLSAPSFFSSIALNMYIYHKCSTPPTNGELPSFEVGRAPGVFTGDACPWIRYAFSGHTIFWLFLPMSMLLLFRILRVEVGRMWQSADERSFEILQALISLSSRVITELKDGELSSVEPPALRQRLIKENETMKEECERRLTELYTRRGGAEAFVAIKTRRAAFDLLYDAAQFFQAAKQLGELNESEYKMAMNAVDDFRNKTHQWTTETCKKPLSIKKS